MDFPAQIEAMPHEQVNRPSTRDEQLTLMIRSKYDLLKSKQPLKFNLIKNYAPMKMEAYNETMSEFKTLLASIQEGETPDLTRFLPLIFGTLEGSSSQQEQLKVLVKRFGGNIQKIEIQQIIRGKVRNVNYGSDKRKQTNIREVSNKEAFESIGEYFDLKEIKNHRKMCNSIKSYLKSLKKFKQCMESSEDNEIFNEESQQNVAYIEFANEEINFNKLKIPNQILGIQSEPMTEQKEELPIENSITPAKKDDVLTPHKEETASGKKNDESENKDSNSRQQQKVNQAKDNDQDSKPTRKRRTKEEILRDQEAKQKQKEQKALELKKKEEEKLQKQLQKQKERIAKEKQKEMEREAKQKEREAKQRQRQAKEKEKEAERLAKEAERLAKEAERKAKQAAKEAERIAREKKNNPGQSLAKWFKPAEPATPMKNQRQQKVQVSSNDTPDEMNEFILSINSKKMSMNDLRNMFKSQKMKEQTYAFEPYYTTVFIHNSRLEFDRFFINEQRFKQYVQPHDEYENGKYDDSSVEYEDFCGDFCDQKMDEMSVEDEEASFNSAIVPDSYRSEDEISSLNDSKDQVNVRISQGAEWSFSGSNNYTADRYTMLCCFEEDAIPLSLSEPQQSNNQLTLNLKCQLYKQIHGYYGAKDVLIKRLASIADKVAKSSLDTLIKQTTTKRGNQRLVKPEIIEFLTEQRESFANELEQIKKKRDEDNAIEMKGKMNQRQKQIERLILEQAGTYYIIDLLHFLRQKGYRMLKRDLNEFINARVGSQWDDVRRRMTKMQLKQKEKINTFLTKKERDAKNKKEGIKQVNEEPDQSEKKSSKDGSSQDNNDKNNEEGGEMQVEN